MGPAKLSDSLLLRLPVEVREMVLLELLDDGGQKTVCIRNATRKRIEDAPSCLRSRYWVMEKSIHHRCYETTYVHAATEADGASGTDSRTVPRLHTAILAVNHQLYYEGARLLYGKHAFDFGPDIEAVAPFFQDRTPYCRSLITDVSVYKPSPTRWSSTGGHCSDRHEWARACQSLASQSSIRRLRLVVEAANPDRVAAAVAADSDLEGPRELSESDVHLLTLIRHECLDWVAEVAKLRGLEDLEVVPDVQPCPMPKSMSMIVFAALSNSIEKGLTTYLKKRVCIPA
ncbi:hypothetical protein VTK73DRAFT_1284 [Phialemonium thermophilum]|uniref:DUF7730 domain-containing protein n=1 Tax=Phialemonium thermophilum TaxID=223376 RepID=A0ABR3XA44_9PEZI